MALVTKIIHRRVDNDSKITEIFYDATGNAVEVKPGKSAIISMQVSEETKDVAGSLDMGLRLSDANARIQMLEGQNSVLTLQVKSLQQKIVDAEKGTQTWVSVPKSTEPKTTKGKKRD